MKLEKALQLEMMAAGVAGTTSADVKGIPKLVGPIVRRVVPAGYTKISSKKKKKKKATKWSDGSDRVDEWWKDPGPGQMFQQLDNVIQQSNQDKFWPVETDPQLYGNSEKKKKKKRKKKKKGEDGEVL